MMSQSERCRMPATAADALAGRMGLPCCPGVQMQMETLRAGAVCVCVCVMCDVFKTVVRLCEKFVNSPHIIYFQYRVRCT